MADWRIEKWDLGLERLAETEETAGDEQDREDMKGSSSAIYTQMFPPKRSEDIATLKTIRAYGFLQSPNKRWLGSGSSTCTKREDILRSKYGSIATSYCNAVDSECKHRPGSIISKPQNLATTNLTSTLR